VVEVLDESISIGDEVNDSAASASPSEMADVEAVNSSLSRIWSLSRCIRAFLADGVLLVSTSGTGRLNDVPHFEHSLANGDFRFLLYIFRAFCFCRRFGPGPSASVFVLAVAESGGGVEVDADTVGAISRTPLNSPQVRHHDV
jgi:hypothetical protein